MLSDASFYDDHRCMQTHDTHVFISTVMSKMDWSKEDDIMMDVGCGSGASCLKLLLPVCPKVKKVIAVDAMTSMIDFAKQKNAHPKIEYHVADIQDENVMSKWTNQVSKAVSIYCFNWLKDQPSGFRNIYRILRPGGEAALLFALGTKLYDSFPLHYKNPKWKKYLPKDLKDILPESYLNNYGDSYYIQLLEDVGFEVVICEVENKTFTYPDDEALKAGLHSRGYLSSYIPEELREEFLDDMLDGFLQYNGRDASGKPVLYYTTASVLIRKPASS